MTPRHASYQLLQAANKCWPSFRTGANMTVRQHRNGAPATTEGQLVVMTQMPERHELEDGITLLGSCLARTQFSQRERLP